MTISETEEVLGSAPESHLEVDGDYSYKLLLYPDRGISLFFRQSYNFRLSAVEINERALSASMLGENLYKRTLSDVLDLLQRNLSEDARQEAKEGFFESAEQRFLEVPALGIIFYFDDTDTLQEVKWSPLLDSEGRFIWPQQ
jgi:hypothetical protein